MHNFRRVGYLACVAFITLSSQANERELEPKEDLCYSSGPRNGIDFSLFARADNLLDEEIRHHTSFIKDEASLPRRNFTLGDRLEF